MTYISSKDFLLEVAKGNVPGHTLVHQFGKNVAVPNGSWEMIAERSVATNIDRGAASTVRIQPGGSTADVSTGTGAREVTFQGLNSSWEEETVSLATNGASASSASTGSFWRVYHAWVSQVGSPWAANSTDITLGWVTGGADILKIPAGEGQTAYGHYAVPTGKTAYLLSAIATVDSGKTCDIHLIQRADLTDRTAPNPSLREQLHWSGLPAGSHNLIIRAARAPIAGPADIYWEAQGAGGTASVTIDFELLLVDD
jgi:hypothetical protein